MNTPHRSLRPLPVWTDDGAAICQRSCRYFDTDKRGCAITGGAEGGRCLPAMVARDAPAMADDLSPEGMIDFLTGRYAAFDATLERQFDLQAARHKATLERFDTLEVHIGGVRAELTKQVKDLSAKIDKQARISQTQIVTDESQEFRLAGHAERLLQIEQRLNGAVAKAEASAQKSGEAAQAVNSSVEKVETAQQAIEEHRDQLSRFVSMVPTKNRRVATFVGYVVFILWVLAMGILQMRREFQSASPPALQHTEQK